MSRFQAINLANLPQPAAIEQWTFDAIVAARFATFLQYWATAVEADPTLPTYNVQSLTSNPGSFLQFTDAFREGLVRQRVNEAVLATSLAFAVGDDLTVIAANFMTARAPGELDPSLRARAQLAWEALSIGGSYGGYAYMARTAAPTDIVDVEVYGHEVPGVALGEVRIVCLGSGANGAVPIAALNAARAAVSARADRKVNDLIHVVPAQLTLYQVAATLILAPGADAAAVQAAQFAATAAYTSAVALVGGSLTLGGLLAAIGYNASGLVQGVEITQPFSGAIDLANAPQIGGGPFQAPICTSIQLLTQGAP